ncbi:MAG: dihydroorotate dehydrogenase [Prevotella sp.]|nr:dihydroorotate dehydrogenase [Prevotella sp.]
MAKIDINIGALHLKNPVMTASGTFGYGLEFQDLVPLEEIGAIIVKGTTLNARQGNDYPRMAETPHGMLNCVGLQNKGAHYFAEQIYPKLAAFAPLPSPTVADMQPEYGGAQTQHSPCWIVNVSGSSPEDYAECAAVIEQLDHIPAIELNISCPNVRDGGMAFGVSCQGAASVVRAVRKAYSKTLIVKLSPNVTDISEIARAVEAEGADAVSLINTLMGMSIDIERRQPRLSIKTGGLSGPCIKPVALRMVWQVARAVKLPVIGMGGIMTAADAIEFFMVGASAVEIGTANFIDPTVTIKVRDGINRWLDEHGIADVHEIIGTIQ